VPVTTKPSAFPRRAPTRERAWRSWARAQPALARRTLAAEASRVVVVSPHPDDETLACGGLLAELHAHGCGVLVIAVTDGEGSHPGVAELASVRQAEQRAALRALGLDADAIRLGLPDAAVAAHEPELRARLRSLVTTRDLLLAPWSRDGHTDHDACGSAAEAVATDVGSALLEYPVWAWQWATADDLDGADWSTFSPEPAAQRAKASALACFPSQTTDRYGEVIVDGTAIARFQRPFEVYARVR
jgi:LmbE family N-acetylglucosaminyl deacetylase